MFITVLYFRFFGIQQICSNLAEVTEDNCVRYLELAELISARSLLEESITIILQNLDTITSTDDFISLSKRNPEIMQIVFERIKEARLKELENVQ